MLKTYPLNYIPKPKMPLKKLKIRSIRQAFANTLVKLAALDSRIYVVSMGLTPSLYLNQFAHKFPHRFIECGVAESNAAAVAAGLAKTNKIIFLASYACFSPGINWSVIKQSICENHANVKIIGSHAGLLSTDLGASHQMLEDVALMRSLPNMQVFSPLDAVETKKIMTTISQSPLPAYLRLVRASTPVVYPSSLPFIIGRSRILKSGRDVTVIGHGPVLTAVFGLKTNYSLEIINCSSIKPLDIDTIIKSVTKTGRLLCLEDHQKIGGLGEAVAAALLPHQLPLRFIHLGIDNQFGQSGRDYHQLYHRYGLGSDSIIEAINTLCH